MSKQRSHDPNKAGRITFCGCGLWQVFVGQSWRIAFGTVILFGSTCPMELVRHISPGSVVPNLRRYRPRYRLHMDPYRGWGTFRYVLVYSRHCQGGSSVSLTAFLLQLCLWSLGCFLVPLGLLLFQAMTYSLLSLYYRHIFVSGQFCCRSGLGCSDLTCHLFGFLRTGNTSSASPSAARAPARRLGYPRR